MADVVIVNPSSNMKVTSREMAAYGKDVLCVRTSDVPFVAPERIFYFFAGYNACFTPEPQGEVDKEDKVFMFKRSIISRFRMWGITKALGILNPELINGNFTDLLMFRRGMLRCDSNKDNLKTFPNITAVCNQYPDARVLTSLLPDYGSNKLCFWDTDFDLKETFGKDYFVFFTSNSRMEGFCYDNRLVTLSKEKNHIDILQTIVPSVSKFEFKLASEKNVMQNNNPWVVKIPTPKVSIVNDYSFFNTSVDMQSSWYSKLAGAINFETGK